MEVQVFTGMSHSLIYGCGKRAGAERKVRGKRYQTHSKLMKTTNKRDCWFTLNEHGLKMTEDMGNLLPQRTTWQATVPGAQSEGQTATRSPFCCPTCPEVLLLCSNPHPITLSTWGKSLISSVMYARACVQACRWRHRSLSGLSNLNVEKLLLNIKLQD